tara:strand:- start:461 stop:859 length:399 start_codon:yes stop_codon:yes gene_type:complete
MKMDNIINNNDMDKEQLETNLAALELLQNETNDKLTDYKAQIVQVKRDIEDLNKPELTPMQLDGVYEAIESTINDFDFDDTNNYNIEYELDYDGRVNAQSLEFQNSYELVEKIVEKVTRLFKEADCPEDDNS